MAAPKGTGRAEKWRNTTDDATVTLAPSID
jgi:hypothetical protein